MLLSEMVRRVRNEELLVKETAKYYGYDAHDWTTRVSKNITLTAPRIVLIKWNHEHVFTETHGASRVLLGSTPIWGSGYVPSGATGLLRTPRCMIMLPAGSYTLNFQTSQLYAASTRAVVISNIEIGYADLADTVYQNASGSISVGVSAEATVISVTIPASSLPARRTAVGKVKNYVALIYVSGHVVNNAISKMKNPGEANESGYINWKIFVNGSQKPWNERYDDAQTSNPAYAEGAFGRISVILSAKANHTIEVKAYNGASSAQTCNAHIAIIISPWLLSDSEYEPIELNFPQGSTLYVVAEPLLANPTKTIKLGKHRAISFGDATDFYSTASGTDILQWNYTFESVEVANCILFMDGYGGCISIIAVDVR